MGSLDRDTANRMRRMMGMPPLKAEEIGMRRFYLDRKIDGSGVSGVGRVAEGVEFADGTVVLRWLGRMATTVVFNSIDHVRAIHGHGGHTEVVWLDGPDRVPGQPGHRE